MITESEIYWITRMDYLSAAFLTIGMVGTVVGFLGTLIAFLCSLDENITEESKKYARKVSLTFFFIFIVTLPVLFGGLLTPNTKEMCTIKVLPTILNDEDVQEIPQTILDLANEWMDELRPDKKISAQEAENGQK